MSGWFVKPHWPQRFYMICVAIFTCSSFLMWTGHKPAMLIFSDSFRRRRRRTGSPLTGHPRRQFSAKQRGMGLLCMEWPSWWRGHRPARRYITGQFSWHWIFFINVLLAFFRFRSRRDCPRPRIFQEHDQSNFRVDYMGHRTYRHRSWILAICSRQGQENDWFASNAIFISFTISMVRAGCPRFSASQHETHHGSALLKKRTCHASC